MKKLIATSPRFGGEVHVVYNQENILMLLDFTHAELTAQQTEFFKGRVPTFYQPDIFLSLFGNTQLTVVEGSYELTFMMFWEKYKHKVNKKRCEPLWEKLSKTKQVKAYHGITAYLNHLAARPWKNQADPETYLKNEYWETDWTKVK